MKLKLQNNDKSMGWHDNFFIYTNILPFIVYILYMCGYQK